jgi:hypothetical protein
MDRNSTNGTEVDGIRLPGEVPQPLQDGSVIQIRPFLLRVPRRASPNLDATRSGLHTGADALWEQLHDAFAAAAAATPVAAHRRCCARCCAQRSPVTGADAAAAAARRTAGASAGGGAGGTAVADDAGRCSLRRCPRGRCRSCRARCSAPATSATAERAGVRRQARPLRRDHGAVDRAHARAAQGARQAPRTRLRPAPAATGGRLGAHRGRRAPSGARRRTGVDARGRRSDGFGLLPGALLRRADVDPGLPAAKGNQQIRKRGARAARSGASCRGRPAATAKRCGSWCKATAGSRRSGSSTCRPSRK